MATATVAITVRGAAASTKDTLTSHPLTFSRPPLPEPLPPQETQADLFQKVAGLRRELADWRVRLDGQVATYRFEFQELRRSLTAEVEGLRQDCSSLRQSVSMQLQRSSSLSRAEIDVTPNGRFHMLLPADYDVAPPPTAAA